MKFELEENPIPLFEKVGFKSRGGSETHFKKNVKDIKGYPVHFGKAYIHLIISHTYKHFYMCEIHIDVPTGKQKNGLWHKTIHRHQLINYEKLKIERLSFAGKLNIIQVRAIGLLTQRIYNKFN